MNKYVISNKQARLFILLKQGLLGDYKFISKQGILDFIKQAGCIQFDPIDVCGKNAELTLQSRVKGFTKQMLYELLYQDRKLIDYFDKNLSIICIEDWKYFSRIRLQNQQHGASRDDVNEVSDAIKAIIKEKGFVCSKDINLNKKVDWYWSETNLSRAALETLYFRGDLIIHHKKGTIKYYSLAEDYIPQEILCDKDPSDSEFEFMKWRTLRRISAVGRIWNKPSDAWLNIHNFKAVQRNNVFEALIKEDKITEIQIEDKKDKFYCLTSDMDLIKSVLGNNKFKERTELIAPLDSMLWDRKLIKEIFNFDYKWEIYTPAGERKYGYYVLPIISGINFVGRTEIINDKNSKELIIKNIWYENNIEPSKKLKSGLESCFKRFAKFNECEMAANK
ncbi:MAG: winged helix DNA-binding domain-containing protein [Bacillota bacterium]|nr:winged helix DNA-binding domain-containing protein [Bacillota bacterium]